MKCGSFSSGVVWRPCVSSLDWKIALIPSLVAGVLGGRVGFFRSVALEVCKSRPTVRVSRAPGCVRRASTGPRCSGMRYGLAAGGCVWSGFRLSMTRPLESHAPLGEPSDIEGPPALPPHSDRFGGNITGNFRVDPAGERQCDRARRGLRATAFRGSGSGSRQPGNCGARRPDPDYASHAFQICRMTRRKLVPRWNGIRSRMDLRKVGAWVVRRPWNRDWIPTRRRI